jgi:hypothetical protein
MVKLRFNLVLVAEIMKTPKNLVKESCTPSLPIPGVKMNYSALGELGWTNQTTALHQGRTKILTCVPEEMRLWRHARWRAVWMHSGGRRRTSHLLRTHVINSLTAHSIMSAAAHYRRRIYYFFAKRKSGTASWAQDDIDRDRTKIKGFVDLHCNFHLDLDRLQW